MGCREVFQRGPLRGLRQKHASYGIELCVFDRWDRKVAPGKEAAMH